MSVTAASILSDAASSQAHYKPSTVDKPDNLEYDLGNLMAYDFNPLDMERIDPQNAASTDEYLHELGRDNAQLLMNRIFSLPSRPLQSESGRIADLPKPSTRLPRALPIPKAKEPTKWEAFAKLKGIEKRKRGRMVYDEEKQAYAPRWGYKRANDDSENVIIEHREGDDPSVDPWTKMRQEKKQKIDKNKKQQERNLKAAGGQRVPGAIDLTSALPSAPKKTHSSKRAAANESKADKLHHVQLALKLAQKSTASMGKFDVERKGEVKVKERTIESQSSTSVDVKGEKSRALSMLSKVLGKETDAEKFSVEKAAGIGQREKENANRKAKQASASNKDKKGGSKSNKGGQKRKR